MKIHLFIPCFIDQFFPEVGKATVLILERLGINVIYPINQTCCGQPAFNTGYYKEAEKIAKKFCLSFRNAEIIVAPSGSCVSMVKKYPILLPDERDIGNRTFELCDFLVNKVGNLELGGVLKGRAALHMPCHLQRELKGGDNPKKLLKYVKDLELVDLETEEECCGFGGTFSIKFPELSTSMGNLRVEEFQKKGIKYLISPESSCLMHLGGIIKKKNIPIKPLHIAQVLANFEEEN